MNSIYDNDDDDGIYITLENFLMAKLLQLICRARCGMKAKSDASWFPLWMPKPPNLLMPPMRLSTGWSSQMATTQRSLPPGPVH